MWNVVDTRTKTPIRTLPTKAMALSLADSFNAEQLRLHDAHRRDGLPSPYIVRPSGP